MSQATEAEAVVTVRLGEATFGIPIPAVREVLRPPPITRVPFPPAGVCGLSSLRGEVLPVIDLGIVLRGVAAERPGRMVIVSSRSGSAALLVDGITGFVEGAERSVPPRETEAALPPGVVVAIITRGVEEPVTIVDVESLLPGGPASTGDADVSPPHPQEEDR